MKITMAEKVVKILGGEYSYSYSYLGDLMFIEFHTNKVLIFEDKLKAIKRILSMNNAKIQFIEASSKGIVVHVVMETE